MNLSTNPFNLTDAEAKVALILVNECLAGMGGDRPADLEHDEYTWADAADLKAHGYSRHEAAGFFSSLTTKGFLEQVDDPKDMFGQPQVHMAVATKGWKWVDTVWDDNQTVLA